MRTVLRQLQKYVEKTSQTKSLDAAAGCLRDEKTKPSARIGAAARREVVMSW